MANLGKRYVAIFNVVRYRKIGAFIFKVGSIASNIDNDNTRYPNPIPKVVDVQDRVKILGVAEAKVKTRVVGSVADRDVAYNKVVEDVNAWLRYIQGLADAANNEEDAQAIILNSGFDIKNHGSHTKPPLAAKNTGTSGTAKLVAKSVGQYATYYWQMSADNGTTWVNQPETLKAKTLVSGLTPATKVLFRMRSLTKKNSTDWTQPVSLIIQ